MLHRRSAYATSPPTYAGPGRAVVVSDAVIHEHRLFPPLWPSKRAFCAILSSSRVGGQKRPWDLAAEHLLRLLGRGRTAPCPPCNRGCLLQDKKEAKLPEQWLLPDMAGPSRRDQDRGNFESPIHIISEYHRTETCYKLRHCETLVQLRKA